MSRKIDIWSLVTLLVLGMYGVFLIYPLFNLLLQAVVDKETGRFTLAYFVKFFGKPYYFNTLLNSFKVTLSVTVLTVMLGTPLAYIFTRYNIRGKSLLRILIILSSMSAPFIGAYSWILLLGRSGVITRFFRGNSWYTNPKHLRVCRNPGGAHIAALSADFSLCIRCAQERRQLAA